MGDANPDLTALARAKRDAKRLRKALAAGDPAAAARLAAVFGDRRRPETATHADCLQVLAREHGAESWPRLKLAVETAALDRSHRVEALGRAVTAGNFLMVERLLALDPALPHAHLGLQLAFALDEASASLARDPAAATRPIADRPPVCWLAFSRLPQRAPEMVERQIALLDALIAGGADVNAGQPAEPGSDHRLSPLYGALGHAGNLELARALLARGANPNDNESLYHATELGDLEGVRLLFEHGAEVGHTNAFLRMLDVENADGVRLFLSHGANPNAPPYRHPTAEPAEARNALHHAILRGRSGEIIALLLDAGVDTTAPYDGRSPYALARIWGNASAARLLESRGLATPLAPVERFLASLAEADSVAARAVLAEHPSLLGALTVKDLTRQTELAMAADHLETLRLMAELGFDPDLPGEGGMPPVHAAAWWGHADIVEMYVGLGARLDTVNGYGADALGTAVHGSANCPGRDHGDYERTVRALVASGAMIRPERGHLEMGSEAVTLLLEALLEEERS